jgi:hypothetical protein
MFTLKRHFECLVSAPRARGEAIEIANAGMQRWGTSPDSGVLPTR